MNARIVLTVLSLAAAASVRAEAVSVDVDAWADVGTGVTNGWEVSGIERYSGERGARFGKKDEFALSPKYRGCVTQLVMTVKSASATTARYLTIIPIESSGSVTNQMATRSESYVEQFFAWSPEDGLSRFKLQNYEGTGSASWGIRSLTVYVDRIEAPIDLNESNIYSDALPVSWTPDARAVSNELQVARVVTVPPEFNQLERWDFSILTNSTGNPLSFEDVPGSESLLGVSGEYLNVQAHSGGHVQAGNTIGAGKLKIALASAGQRTAILRMYRSDAAGTDGPVTVSSVDRGGVTNSVAEPCLTTSPTDFVVDLTEDARALLIESPYKTRRIRVEDVRIVTDYVPGQVTTNAPVPLWTVMREKTVRRLSPGDWLWRVRSFDGSGVESPWSPYREVSLDADNPPFRKPGLAVIVR